MLDFSDSSEQTGSVMVPLPPGERESWGAISGIVVLVILVVLLLALLLLYRRRQKDKQNNTPAVSFSTSRTVNSEYAVPGTVQDMLHHVVKRSPVYCGGSKLWWSSEGRLMDHGGSGPAKCSDYCCYHLFPQFQNLIQNQCYGIITGNCCVAIVQFRFTNNRKIQ